MSKTLDELLIELTKVDTAIQKRDLTPNQMKSLQQYIAKKDFANMPVAMVLGGLGGAIASLFNKGDFEKLMEEAISLLKPQNIRSDRATAVTDLPPGTPVYCNLAVLAEHTGVTLADGNIAQLNGDGIIESVTPEEFVNRLDGRNPARIIRYPRTLDGQILHLDKAAVRAQNSLGKRRAYNVIFDNCHQYAYGCLSGNFENSNNFFWMFNDGIRNLFDKNFDWCIWDYFE